MAKYHYLQIMAKYRYLQRVVKDGGPEDTRIWMWTSELAKDPNFREVFPDQPGKKPAPPAENKLVWAKHTGFGKFDIIKTIPAEAGVEGSEPVDEIIEHIEGKEAAMARVAKLNGDTPADEPELED